MSSVNIRFRQVHLDFHTSPLCEDVGVDFQPQIFAETVKMGHVDSMTVFAKCHHGFSYYPTQVGQMHPHLKFDLMGQQIEALHSIGVRAPIYVSLMWDDLAGEQHGEWVIVEKNGSLRIRPPLSNQSPVFGGWGWSTLDLTSGYGDYVIAQVEELCRTYPVDGFFFDICFPLANYAPWNQDRMRQEGIRLDDDAAVFQFALHGLYKYLQRLSSVVHDHVPDATVFYNGTVTPLMAMTQPFQTHLEIESLPTAAHDWGYMHYPIMSRHARTTGMDFLGMTGRFHKSWADFGGLKTRDQLDYECGTIVGAGGKISVGDQLHPRGVLDPAVYRLLGHAFERIERLEPWLANAKPTAEVAILSMSAPMVGARIPGHSEDVEGTAQLFLETGIQFDIIDATAPSFVTYALLVLPDGLVVDDVLKEKLTKYVTQGGKLLLSGTAALDQTSKQFCIADIPVEYVEPAPTVPGYLRLDSTLVGDTELAIDYDYAFYEQSHQVRPVAGATSHGELFRALFNRTWEHFTSHAHAPVGASLKTPLVVENEHILYFAAPFFRAYRNHDYWAYRAIVLNALRRFLSRPLLIPSAPGWVECTLHTQEYAAEQPERRIIHLVAYHPRRTLQPTQHVDQSQDVSGLSMKVLMADRTPEHVYLAPERQALDFTRDGDYIFINLPPVGAHTVIVIE
jgi:hypothetical protein